MVSLRFVIIIINFCHTTLNKQLSYHFRVIYKTNTNTRNNDPIQTNDNNTNNDNSKDNNNMRINNK